MNFYVFGWLLRELLFTPIVWIIKEVYKMKDRIFKMALLTRLTKAMHSGDDIKGRRVPHKKRLFVIKLDLKRKGGGDATSEISTPIFCWFPTFSSFDEFDSYRIKKKHFTGFDSNWTDKKELHYAPETFKMWSYRLTLLKCDHFTATPNLRKIKF